MTTQPTPDKLAKYREEFEKTETNPYLEKTALGMYAVTSIENRWQGYLRAKQETEQVMKLAKFGAMVAQNGTMSLSHDAYKSGVFADANFGSLAPNIETTIKELLND